MTDSSGNPDKNHNPSAINAKIHVFVLLLLEAINFHAD